MIYMYNIYIIYVLPFAADPQLLPSVFDLFIYIIFIIIA